MRTEAHTNVSSPARTFAIVLSVIGVVVALITAGGWYAYTTWVAPRIPDVTKTVQETADTVKNISIETKGTIDAHIDAVGSTVKTGTDTVERGITEAQETANDIRETKKAFDTLTEEAGTIFTPESDE